MLSRLRVDSFALIDRVDVEFGPGLTVITGETGAGKSILIGALDAILGAPVSADLVRQGAARCTVEGLFELGPDHPARGHLEAGGFEVTEEGQLVLGREIRTGGRSRAFVNGSLVPARRLREAGRLLVDLHGQHQHQSLLDPASHAGFVDACGGFTQLAAQVAGAYGALQAARLELRALEAERERLHGEEELRRYQLEEIRRLAPQAGEIESLEAEVSRRANQEALVSGAAGLFEALYDADGAVVDRLGHVRRELERLAELDACLTEPLEALSSLVIGVEDVAGALRDYAEGLEADPERLEAARGRLEELRRLLRRHDCDLPALLARADELAGLETRSQGLEGDVETLRRRVADGETDFARTCAELTARRRQACQDLARSVAAGLAELGMSGARFHADLVPLDEPHEGGAERVEFHLSANRGEAALPLARVASGGELSRLMLVLKQIVAARDAVSTLVFDEVDSGISGRVAAAVGHRLAALAQARQTLVITHLPQIAGLARQHLSVRKAERDGRTVTEVVVLDGEARAEEIAGLLAGDSVSETARRHARELLGP